MPATVPDVVVRFEQIEASLPASDGVACFARLYRQVTEGVNRELADHDFADPRFLERLDAVFAGLFFSALAASQHGSAAAPAAWRPLFDCRERKHVAPLQFALAGMNAHINRDLPVALVMTCTELNLELAEGSPEHADFEHVNRLLAEVETQIKAGYMTGWLATVDRMLHRCSRIDDIVAMWDVSRARDAAWTNGRALWALRDEPSLSAEFVAVLDRMVGLGSRGLLLPAETWLEQATRAVRHFTPTRDKGDSGRE